MLKAYACIWSNKSAAERLSIVLTLVVAGCSSSTVRVGKDEYFKNKVASGRASGDDDSERGFLNTESVVKLCDKDPQKKPKNFELRAGYFVRPRQPKTGETQSDYKNFLEAEKVRVVACAKAALYCTTRKFSVPDDVVDSSGNCFVEAKEDSTKPYLKLIVEGEKIICATGNDPGYVSQLHEQTYTRLGWIRDPKLWKEFCLKHQKPEECSKIIQTESADTTSTTAWYPYSTWAVKVLYTDTPVLQEIKGTFTGTASMNIAPLCKLLETRYE